MKKLVIIDHFLITDKGHDEQYDFSIAKEAIKRGIHAEVWCPNRKKQNQPGFIKQYLNTPFWERKGWILKILSAIASIFEWRRLFRRGELDKDTVVFIQMVKFPVLLMFTCATFGLVIKPKIVMVLRRAMNNLLMKYLYRRKNTIFISDSELISEELKAEKFVSSKVLPMPYLPAKEEIIYKKSNVIVGYFGEARYDKGFDLLAEMIEIIITNHKNIFFKIQANIHKGTALMKETLHKIEEIGRNNPGRIEIMSRFLTYSEYTDYMQKCSIIIAPYRKEFYGKGTSGILAEAIACGNWVIVPSGTWMADQKCRYDKVVIFDEPNAQSLSEAVELCIKRDKEIDHSKIVKQVDEWYKFHSPENYIRILSSI